MSARLLFTALSPAGENGRLTVLLFHRVLPHKDPLFPAEPDAAQFEMHMRWMNEWFNVLPLPEAVERLLGRSLPARAAAITFDDGYADNYAVALPILKRLRIPTTFFIATGFLNGGCMFNDVVIEAVRGTPASELDLSLLDLGRHSLATIEERRSAVAAILARLKYFEPAKRSDAAKATAEIAGIAPPSDLMLNTDQVKALSAAGMTIGAHTVNHPILSRIDEKEALHEMRESRAALESMTGEPVRLFAYPNGKPGTDYTSAHVGLARRAGFAAACSTGWGVARSGCDSFQIPRFTPWDHSRWRYALRLARNMRHAASFAI